ncbi:MAG: glycerophosphoryl diester phosphodiesterase membrane domain-containing protein, partial [Dehalococcoidales bacterium]|nr:glycerophosphoryl diester phosphodiesterase membrane domain-containing protein [Dehalococcoidales bacterium]
YQPKNDTYIPPQQSSRPITSSALNDKIDPMEAIRVGWEAMKNNLGLFLGIIGVAIAIYGIEWFIQTIMMLRVGKQNLFTFILQLAFGYLNVVIFSLGYNKVCLKMADGEETELSDLFSCFHLGGKFILACLIMGLMFVPIVFLMIPFVIMMKNSSILGLTGMLALIVAVSILAIRFVFISYLIVDKEMDAMESIKNSWNMTRGSVWDISVFFLLETLVIIAGALCLGVGLIAALPTTAVATAYYYRQLSKI